jgi:hypothetical protein
MSSYFAVSCRRMSVPSSVLCSLAFCVRIYVALGLAKESAIMSTQSISSWVPQSFPKRRWIERLGDASALCHVWGASLPNRGP